VKRTDGSAQGRGIYLREPLETRQNVSISVNIKPVVHEVPVQPIIPFGRQIGHCTICN